MQLPLRQQARDLGLRTDVAVSLGRRNDILFNRLNDKLALFKKIVVLNHPRYLMQYRRRNLAANVAHHVQAFGSLVG